MPRRLRSNVPRRRRTQWHRHRGSRGLHALAPLLRAIWRAEPTSSLLPDQVSAPRASATSPIGVCRSAQPPRRTTRKPQRSSVPTRRVQIWCRRRHDPALSVVRRLVLPPLGSAAEARSAGDMARSYGAGGVNCVPRVARATRPFLCWRAIPCCDASTYRALRPSGLTNRCRRTRSFRETPPANDTHYVYPVARHQALPNRGRHAVARGSDPCTPFPRPARNWADCAFSQCDLHCSCARVTYSPI